MNHRFNNLIQSIRSIMLRDDSFARIRGSLSSYADLHAVSPAVAVSPIASPFFVFFRSREALYAGALVLFVMISGGSVSAGAERAVPGDSLYAIKVNVNEKVAATLADTAEERAELSVKLATRRADEAITLLAAGKLDETTATYLDEQIAVHVDESNIAATELEAGGDIGASLAVRTELESELSARADTFAAATAPAADSVADVGIEATTMMMATKSAPLPETPVERFATNLRVQVEKAAEARVHTEEAILPGLATSAVDLEVLNTETPSPAADTTSTATFVVEPADAATTTPEADKAKYAPAPNNAWPADQGAERKFWLPGGH